MKVYQSKEDKYIDMKVVDIYRYIGDSDELEFINGKIYNCVGYENDMARIVDETGEDYLYYLDNFVKIDKNNPLTLQDKWNIDDEIFEQIEAEKNLHKKVYIEEEKNSGYIVDVFKNGNNWIYVVEIKTKNGEFDVITIKASKVKIIE